ncbi:hypothetical protein ES703_79164 [subsurface metagenome]
MTEAPKTQYEMLKACELRGLSLGTIALKGAKTGYLITQALAPL